jgi:hypothetical protein
MVRPSISQHWRRWRAWIIAIAVMLAIGAGVSTWLHRPRPLASPQEMSSAALADLLASDRFAGLPEKDKVPYIQYVLSLNPQEAAKMVSGLTSDQRNAAFKNMGQLLIIESTNEYYAKKTATERTAYIDHVLDWYQAVTAATARLPDMVKVSQQDMARASAERHQLAGQLLGGLSPSQSARMGEFWKQLLLRRAARAIFNMRDDVLKWHQEMRA